MEKFLSDIRLFHTEFWKTKYTAILSGILLTSDVYQFIDKARKEFPKTSFSVSSGFDHYVHADKDYEFNHEETYSSIEEFDTASYEILSMPGVRGALRRSGPRELLLTADIGG